MKKIKIHYWSPFISKIATVKAVLNSAYSMSKFSKNSFDVSIINSFGEFKTFETNSNLKYFKTVSLLKKDYSKIFSDKGFILSRLSWFLIVIITFFPLLKLIKKDKPDYLVIHLLTILPLIINYFFNLN